MGVCLGLGASRRGRRRVLCGNVTNAATNVDGRRKHRKVQSDGEHARADVAVGGCQASLWMAAPPSHTSSRSPTSPESWPRDGACTPLPGPSGEAGGSALPLGGARPPLFLSLTLSLSFARPRSRAPLARLPLLCSPLAVGLQVLAGVRERGRRQAVPQAGDDHQCSASPSLGPEHPSGPGPHGARIPGLGFSPRPNQNPGQGHVAPSPHYPPPARTVAVPSPSLQLAFTPRPP